MSLTINQTPQAAAGTWKDRHQPQTFTNGRTEPSRQVEWYQPTLKSLPDTAKQVFRDYSGIPEEDILDHVYRVRDKAWDILPYPCIGVFRFLDFGAKRVPIYPEVLRRVQSGATFLDLGCCFGQDIRKLVSDGAPSDRIIGVDIEGQFAELGYELFKDRDSLKAKFYAASIFDDFFLNDWTGKIDIIYLGSFLHLFGLDKQKIIMRQLNKLLRKQPGSMVFGRHLGAQEGGEYRMKALGWDLYRHSHETICSLFEQAGGDWNVESQLTRYESDGWDDSRRGWQGDETRQMTFFAELKSVDRRLGGPMIDSVSAPHSVYRLR